MLFSSLETPVMEAENQSSEAKEAFHCCDMLERSKSLRLRSPAKPRLNTFCLFSLHPQALENQLLAMLWLARLDSKSGLSFGSGLTRNVQWKAIGDSGWVGDTPGLNDKENRAAAIEEITKALKTGQRHLKLVFLVTLQTGKVRAEDVTTIKLILDSLPGDIKYGIIVNQVTPKVFEKIHNPEDNASQLIAASLTVKGTPSMQFIHHYRKISRLEDAKDEVRQPTSDLLDFIEDLHANYINPENVKDVQADEY